MAVALFSVCWGLAEEKGVAPLKPPCPFPFFEPPIFDATLRLWGGVGGAKKGQRKGAVRMRMSRAHANQRERVCTTKAEPEAEDAMIRRGCKFKPQAPNGRRNTFRRLDKYHVHLHVSFLTQHIRFLPYRGNGGLESIGIGSSLLSVRRQSRCPVVESVMEVDGENTAYAIWPEAG